MIHAIGQSLYRTVTTYPVASTVGGVAVALLGVGLCSKSSSSERRQTVSIDWQDGPSQPLPQRLGKERQKLAGNKRLNGILSGEEQGWVADLFNPSKWGELSKTLAGQPIFPEGQDGVDQIRGAQNCFHSGKWGDNERWYAISYAVSLHPLIQLFENRVRLDIFVLRIRDQLLPGAEALFQRLPQGKKKEELASLIREMELVRQEPLTPANLTPLWEIPPARDREWMEEVALPEEGPWLQNHERQNEALLSERGRYATLLWALQHSSIEGERRAFAAWNQPAETGLTGFWWKDCWSLGKTFFAGVGSLERTLRGFRGGELAPLPFDPMVGAELTIRVWEAIPINHGAKDNVIR